MASEPAGTRSETALSYLFILATLVILTQLVQGVHGWVELNAQRSQLEARLTAQEQVVEEAGKVRAQLDSLAAGVAKLGEQGNTNAMALLERLKAQGITLRAPPKQ